MRVGILQPGYLPWLGFFEQVYRSDVFILYDDVQYNKHGWRNRNKIKTAQGTQWLTVPVNVNLSEKPLINQVAINNKTQWRKDHLLSIKYNYSKAPYFKQYIKIFEDAYAKEWDLLIDIDLHFIYQMLSCLGIDKGKIRLSSSLDIGGDTMERLVNICRHFKADEFYEGAAGKDYIPQGYFEERSIKLEFQDYKHPVYKQLYGEFISHLSIIDLLFNHGPDSLAILLGKK